MMKRIISLILILSLLIPAAAIMTKADDTGFNYTYEDIEALYYDFEYVSSQVETFIFDDQVIAYLNYAKSMENKKTGSTLIKFANKILGEEPDKKYYTEVLTNMIALMEHDLSQQVEAQTQFDDMKDLGEYALDVVDIATGFVGINVDSDKMETVLDVVSDGIDLVIDTKDEIKYYELILKNYSAADEFLEAIQRHTDNDLLKTAASELRRANQELFSERIATMNTHADNSLTFLAKNFLDDFSFAIMKNCDSYSKDSVVKDYVDFGEEAYKKLDDLLSVGETVFDMAMLGADVVFGTTNTFRRHNEMTAMANIAAALIDACNEINVSLSDPLQTVYSDISQKCRYYELLITVHARGEHLIYSLNQNDAGILSAINALLDCFRDEDSSVYYWYKGQVARLEENCDLVLSVFAGINQQKKVVHNGFELHDGFIAPVAQKTEVPEGWVGIYSFDDFRAIADSCPEDTVLTSLDYAITEINTASFILMNDITFPAEYESAAAFYGVIDGNGYTMKNVSKPLFRAIGNARVENLGIEVRYSADFEDENANYGAIATYTFAFYNGEGTYVENCFVKGSVSISCRSGYFAGLIGSCDNTHFKNSYNSADISVKTRQGGYLGGLGAANGKSVNCFNEGDLYMHATCGNSFDPESIDICIGGITGYMSWDNIENCYNTGTLKGESDLGCQVDVGGIAGVCRYDSDIRNSYNVGEIINVTNEEYDPEDDYTSVFNPTHTAGGIIGVGAEDFSLENCYNAGKVMGEHYCGGIAGAAWGTEGSIENCYNTGSIAAVQYAGGIAGHDYMVEIFYCFNTGSATGGTWCGAIAGTINKAEEYILGCYYLNNGLSATSAGIDYAGTLEITEEELAKQETFVDFDFFNVWRLYPDDTMPTLKLREAVPEE